jgi:predicted Zn-dependent peptidase
MKKAFFICFLFVFYATFCIASGSEVKVFDVNGLKVIFKPTAKEVISVRIFFRGGTVNYAKSHEGIEALTLALLTEGGTQSKNKFQFHAEAERMGTEFGSSSSYDYSELNMTCVRMHWNESWNLFTDALLNPRFEEEAFQLLKEKMITAARQTETNPDAHLRNLAMQHAFEGGHYGKVPDGTPESLQALSLSDVQNHYKKIIGKKRCFLVVVGNIQPDDLIAKIKSSLASLPNGTPVMSEPRQLITKPGIFIEDRDIATNYIRGMMSAPAMNHPDGVAMRLAMAILRDHFFVELRTKRSLTYAPQAAYSASIVHNPYNIIYASTQKPKESLQVMIDVINKFKAEGFKQKELDNQKEQSITQYYMGLQSARDQSYNLGMAEMWGDVKIADTYHERIRAVTLKQLNRVFDQYTNAIRWTYLGKKDEVNEADFLQTRQSKYKPY